MVQMEMPIRVLHVVSAMNRGGAETLIMNIYRNIDRSKIQFDFISHNSNNPNDFDDEIKSLGGRVFRVQSLGELGPVKYIRELRKIMEQNGPFQAVHAHTDFQSGFVAIAAKMAGIHRRICHSHNNDWTMGNNIKARTLLWILKRTISVFGTNYCACSIAAAHFLFNKSKTDNGRVSILRNGIAVNEYEHLLEEDCQIRIRKELDIPQDAKILGHIGRFYEQKNHRFLLQVIKKATEKDAGIIAILVGDGPLRQEIEREADELGIRNHIRFTGVRKDIPQLMRTLDVFVFPSLFEGFGIVMVEAQAAGVPCVASDSVPIETDMGLGLVKFVRLQAGAEIWAQEVITSLPTKNNNLKEVSQKITDRGFNIKQSVADWVSLYGING